MTTLVKKVGVLYRELVTSLVKRRLEESADVLLVNFEKLKSAEVSDLRKVLKGSGGNLLVVKNSFMRRVFDETKRPAESQGLLDGPTGMVFVKEDPITVSKALVDFAKTHEALTIRGGFMSDRMVSKADVKTMAGLGSRQAVYQQIAGVLNAPMSQLAQGLNQIVTKLAYALKAVGDKKQ